MQCSICGGAIVGTPPHCEFVDCPEDREYDAPVLLCDWQDAQAADEAELWAMRLKDLIENP